MADFDAVTPDLSRLDVVGRAWAGRAWVGRAWVGRNGAGRAWVGRAWVGRAWVGRDGAGRDGARTDRPGRAGAGRDGRRFRQQVLCRSAGQMHCPSIHETRGERRCAPLPRAPAQFFSENWAGPDGPARTRSVVHQESPVAHERAMRVKPGIRSKPLSVIAPSCRSRSIRARGGRGRSRQTRSGEEPVTPLSRTVSAVASSAPKPSMGRPGGSAASLPVRGFM
jgi:hypothetical protein